MSGRDTLNVADASWKGDREKHRRSEGHKKYWLYECQDKHQDRADVERKKNGGASCASVPNVLLFHSFLMTEGACIAVANQQRAT